MKALAAVLLVVLVSLSGCTQQPGNSGPPAGVPEAAYSACMNSCVHTRDAGDRMENGPCLLDPVPVQPDWVCDIAHSPRESIDDLPEKQCSYYREGKSSHFIELTPECELIRAV